LNYFYYFYPLWVWSCARLLLRIFFSLFFLDGYQTITYITRSIFMCMEESYGSPFIPPPSSIPPTSRKFTNKVDGAGAASQIFIIVKRKLGK
jgi:hypothetical protein